MFNKLSISKSRYLSGLQCPKLLWCQYNAKGLIPPPDAATQKLFDRGHKIGDLAKKLYPDGIEVEWGISSVEVVARSKLLLKKRKPLFEAGFFAKGAYARVDVLNPVGDNDWDIVEVKSGTAVQDVNLHDLAFQRYCYENAGIPIRRCHIMYVNPEYVQQADVAPEDLFVLEDVTQLLAEYAGGLEEKLAGMLQLIKSEDCPEISMGPRCSSPYRCPMTNVCATLCDEKS